MRATVRHILVKTQGLAKQVIEDLEAGADFIDVAQEFSACPSANIGGELGTFEPDDLPEPFKTVIFSPESPIQEPFGPITTEFGLHIIEITQRTGVASPSTPSKVLDTDEPSRGNEASEEHNQSSSSSSDDNMKDENRAKITEVVQANEDNQGEGQEPKMQAKAFPVTEESP